MQQQTRTPRTARTAASTTTTTTTATGPIPVNNHTLHLRAEPGPSQDTIVSSSDRRIHWAEDVVNNEGMGKKSSKSRFIDASGG